MQKIKNILKGTLLSVLIVLIGHCSLFAQATVAQARQYAVAKDYKKAIGQYDQLYSQFPDSVYTEYMSMLLAAQKYKQAEEVITKQMTLRNNPYLRIDLGNVYAKDKKDDKAKEQFDSILKMINGDDMLTQRIVKAFSDAGRDDYAILAYQKAGQLFGNPNFYAYQLAAIYAKTGDLDKAIDLLLTGMPGQNMNLENVKAQLLEMLGDNTEKLQQTQKILVKKINEQPENNNYADIITWIYTQKNDWDGALIQMEALDERNNEGGKRLVELARTAAKAKQYDAAIKAYDDVIAQGATALYYTIAKSEKLSVAMTQLKNNPAYTPEDVAHMEKLYDSFLVEYPKYYSGKTGADYALLEAQYANNAEKGIEILQRAVADPDIKREMAGIDKLQMGDYYILVGKVWDASLTYSQVDKAYKQDELGEDARFRNAKLAYYRGDFDWAQNQLTVLKASTSDLIANDALYLSVLITENIEDSNIVPLQRFAYADLLLFQNKDKEAEALLDSMNKAYPKHPLNDDILMLRANIALKHRDYIKSLGYLKDIYTHYHDDVLGDDAVFKMAEIYHDYLHQNDKAKEYYEQLIIDYPGSTYVQTARQKLSELSANTTP